MATSGKLVNAWILLAEDEPSGTSYDSANSCYQRLITHNVYRSVDVLFVCFVNTVPTSSSSVPAGDGSSYTLQIDPAPTPHPDGLTNEDYLRFVVRDARANNPNIRIVVTLDYNTLEPNGQTTLSQIFSNTKLTPEQNAQNFAANLMAYLQQYDLDGFDIDWEPPLSDGTTSEQFALVINAIGAQFAQQSKPYLLTISPAVADNLDANAINKYVSFVNLQLYSGVTQPSSFTQLGIHPQLFAYGAKFESNHETALQAVTRNNTQYHYPIYTQWRLNSTNYVFEQTQQVELHLLVFAPPAAATA